MTLTPLILESFDSDGGFYNMVAARICASAGSKYLLGSATNQSANNCCNLSTTVSIEVDLAK